MQQEKSLSRRAAIKGQRGTVFFGVKIIKGQITLLFCSHSWAEEITEQARMLLRRGNWMWLRPSYDRSRWKRWIKSQNKCLLFWSSDGPQAFRLPRGL